MDKYYYKSDTSQTVSKTYKSYRISKQTNIYEQVADLIRFPMPTQVRISYDKFQRCKNKVVMI